MPVNIVMDTRNIADKENVPNKTPRTVCALMLSAFMDFLYFQCPKPFFPLIDEDTLRIFMAQVQSLTILDCIINIDLLWDCLQPTNLDLAQYLFFVRRLEPPPRYRNLCLSYAALVGQIERPVEMAIILAVNKQANGNFPHPYIL